MSGGGGGPNKKKSKEPLWLMSFSDMVLTLMCFFLLLISTMEPNKKKMDNVKDGMEEQTKAATQKSLKTVSKDLEKAIKDKDLTQSAEVEYDADGLHIEFKDGLLFESGLADTNKNFEKVTKDVLTMISQVGGDHKIIIEGHTDDIPVAKGGRYESNWELSAARGVALLRIFERMGVKEERLSIVAYAHTRPKVPYQGKPEVELKKIRAANRRVVIWIE